ncbi:MAG: hypothetical protein BA864_00465 [Desulfuromonadales bacterium C00003093]|nr:MAG: hypothetical protein BA864_00465 [Desulfuromonadales bacterium C00003093]
MRSNPDENNKYPSCFGMLDRVFPIGEEGFRSSPETCLECIHKTECLRSAMAGSGGLTVHEELVDRAYESGMIGFLGRWSKKKDLDRKIKAQKAKYKGR